MLQASTPNISIGEQFDDARASTKLSGGAEPSLPRRLFSDPKNLAFIFMKVSTQRQSMQRQSIIQGNQSFVMKNKFYFYIGNSKFKQIK